MEIQAVRVRELVGRILILHMCVQGLQCAYSKGGMSLEQSHLTFSGRELHKQGMRYSFSASRNYKNKIHFTTSPSSEKDDVLSSDPGVEVEALLAFKQALNKSSQRGLSSWNGTAVSPCKWKGITCSPQSGRVIGIELADMGLEGSISPLVGRLQDLQTFNLSSNWLSGKIPASLVNCTQLALLDLSNNTVSGPIPSQMGRLLQLEILDLGLNFYLDGPIPASLGNCSSLRSIILEFTVIGGEIPDSVGKLRNLEDFSLDSTLNNGPVPASLGNCSSLVNLWLGNAYLQTYDDFEPPSISISLSNSQLTGTLPDELGNLKRLENLAISGTKIEGPFPPWTANFTSLATIILQNNQFSGTIPEYLGRLPLEYLSIFNNQISGRIPSAIGNCSDLFYLVASKLLVQGVIPPELGLLTKLEVLYLHSNSFEGKIPPTLSNCSALEQLAIASNFNMDTQPLEPWIGSLVKLQYLLGAEMHFTGQIPAAMGQLAQLETLDLSANHITGSDSIRILANCSNLQTLLLHENLLSGAIPPELWRLQQMSWLSLAENNLRGGLSEAVANMSRLVRFYCGVNSLTGAIPSRFTELSNLQYASFEVNHFNGSIPVTIGNLSSLVLFVVANNNISGSIPASIGNLTSLDLLSLGANQLTGSIPIELTGCTKITSLYLGVNFLDGHIPEAIGQLERLAEVDLHQNQFSGELPRTLQLCTNLVEVDLSYNAFSGGLATNMFGMASNSLVSLNLSHNSFSGALPAIFGGQPAVSNLQLSSNNFSGSISSSLGALLGLEFLDLSMNNFTGAIPNSLGNLDNLTVLNVSYNQLAGPLPDTGIFVSKNFSADWFLGNPELCGSRLPTKCPVLVRASPCRGLSCHSGRWVTIMSCSAAFALLVIGVGIYLARLGWRVRKKQRASDMESRFLTFAGHVHLSGQQLVKIIDDPLNLIARGSSSSVYKADLGKGPIAIKIVAIGGLRADETGELLEKAISQLQREAQTLAVLRHRNILKVLGMFNTSKMTGLMLEFMPMGSLHSQLHDVRPCTLSWKIRLNIALGVAQGLVYLHEEIEVPIIHRDLKPQNILLDADMTPKLADFGISKLSKVDNPDNAVTASQWCGTVGYIPPEYARDTRVSTRGDVYSFGIVLLELLTGRRATANSEHPQSGSHSSRGDDVHVSLLEWVYKCCSAKDFPPSGVVDPGLLGQDGNLAEKEEQQLKMAIQVGLLCTQDNPQSRPRISDVLGMLSYIERLGEDHVNIPTINDLAQEGADALSS